MFVAKAVAQADVVARVGGDDDGTAGHCPDHRGRVVVVVFGDVEEEVFAADQAAAHVLPEGVFVERFEVYRLFGEGMVHGVGVVAGAVVEVADGLSQCFGAGVEVFGVIDLRDPKDVMPLAAVFLGDSEVAANPAHPRHGAKVGFHSAPRFRRVVFEAQHGERWQGAEEAAVLVDIVAVIHHDDAVVMLQLDEMVKESADVGTLFVVQFVEVAGADLEAQRGIEAVEVGR